MNEQALSLSLYDGSIYHPSVEWDSIQYYELVCEERIQQREDKTEDAALLFGMFDVFVCLWDREGEADRSMVIVVVGLSASADNDAVVIEIALRWSTESAWRATAWQQFSEESLTVNNMRSTWNIHTQPPPSAIRPTNKLLLNTLMVTTHHDTIQWCSRMSTNRATPIHIYYIIIHNQTRSH